MTDAGGMRVAHGPAPAFAGAGPLTSATVEPPDSRTGDLYGAARAAAPAPLPLPEAGGPRDAVTRLRAHGCWYPSANADGTEVAFICDRGGVPQLWAGSVDSDEVRLLDSSPDPVKEVSWSPNGQWIAYTTAPGGGEHTRVLCVRPDGTGRRLLAGADPASSAYLGCWAHDGSSVAVTFAAPATQQYGMITGTAVRDPDLADGRPDGIGPPPTGRTATVARHSSAQPRTTGHQGSSRAERQVICGLRRRPRYVPTGASPST